MNAKENLNYETVIQLVETLYETCLNRKPDDSGKKQYTEMILNASDRISVTNQIIASMMSSEEKLNANRNAQLSIRNKGAFFTNKLLKNNIQFKNIALLGTCVSEKITNYGNLAGRNIFHYLMGSLHYDPVPRVETNQLDAVIVHLTLRHFLWDILGGSVAGDVLHVHSDHQFAKNYDQYLEQFKKYIGAKIDQIKNELKYDGPIFFLSFIEPPLKAQGDFLINRSRSLYRFVRDINDYLEDILSKESNVYYFEINDLLNFVGDSLIVDSVQSHLSHSGLNDGEDTHLMIGSIFERLDNMLIRIKNLSTIKLIITDLDNTLWRGVAAEFETIIAHELTEGWPLGYVEALLEFKRRGGLLAISSKNNHDETVGRFDHIWQSTIKVQDFCALKINWDPKSKNIAEILEETNLLPENVLFIDDNPREIEEVLSVFPTINTLSGEPQIWKNKILYAPEMQTLHITNESAARTELIQAKIQRDHSEKTMNREEFLLSLELKVNFDIILDQQNANFIRAFELINKTNQFNTTGKRWTESEIIQLLDSKKLKIYTAQVEDKFSNNGIVAVALVEEGTISQVVMSCRVFGLGVETALLAYIAKNDVVKEALYNDTGKNKASSFYYADHGFSQVGNAYTVSDLLVEMPHWISEVA
ncbi:HAD-IIIC family phosphatase [Acinetobacter cumulans]|uniref:HAD-IIIC family phosphatase n=1 Tax=Acinetobacter cumulans TaxID=2136182 RepID=A0A3A8FR25_9GAMM|nr:HAD-IIIC family phosphatase [Acinetobacter cumulans]RKG48798.1 HAD-IIIC family phosphatase [Acinetobacter cumulans]